MEWKIFLTIPTNHVEQRPDQVPVQTPHEGAAPGGQGQHRHRASRQEPLEISASVSTTSSNIAYISAPDQIPTILSLCPPARRWCCPGWRGPAPAPAWPRAPSGGSPRLCTGCRCSPAPGTWLQLATSAVNDPSVSQSVITITEKAPTRDGWVAWHSVL